MADNTQNIPAEIIFLEMKSAIAEYVSGLCQQYQIPTAVALQILQEIIYENRLSVCTSLIESMRMKDVPQYNVDLTTQEDISSHSDA